jgi:hypothetical protein
MEQSSMTDTVPEIAVQNFPLWHVGLRMLRVFFDVHQSPHLTNELVAVGVKQCRIVPSFSC